LKTGLWQFLKLRNQQTLKFAPESFSSDEQSNSEEKTIASLNLGSFLITLAQPALVQIVHLYQHQVFTLARKSHKQAELMMLVFYDKRYIFFSPSTYTVL